MSDTITTAVKRTTRRKTATSVGDSSVSATPSTSVKSLSSIISSFNDLFEKIIRAKTEFEKLEKEITEIREVWAKEQANHQQQMMEKREQEETARKREQETYNYEVALGRRKTEDEFAERKAKWEKELAEKREEIEGDKKELELLRKQVACFEEEKEKLVKEACNLLQRDLTNRFETERKLREQEIKAEKEILSLKIESLSSENMRQVKEIEALKKALDEATRQVKDIAVKVIEASNPPPKASLSSE